MRGKTTEVVRPQRLTQNIVIVDGIAHAGKQVIANLLSTVKRGELVLFNQLYENMCIAYDLGKISKDVASTFINTQVDVDLYYLMLSRNTNFRKTDETSAQFSFLEKRHLKRLKLKEGNPAVERIKKLDPILFFMTHAIFGVSDILFETLGDRLKLFLVSIRHPLWLIEMWRKKKWRERIGKELREFHICCRENNKIVPWYAAKWLKSYSKLKPVEQAIFLLQAFWSGQERQYKKLSPGSRRKVFFVPLEPLVSYPMIFLKKYAKILHTETTSLAGKMMKRFKCPRPWINESILKKQRSRIERMMSRENSSRESRQLLEILCNNYEKKFCGLHNSKRERKEYVR